MKRLSIILLTIFFSFISFTNNENLEKSEKIHKKTKVFSCSKEDMFKYVWTVISSENHSDMFTSKNYGKSWNDPNSDYKYTFIANPKEELDSESDDYRVLNDLFYELGQDFDEKKIAVRVDYFDKDMGINARVYFGFESGETKNDCGKAGIVAEILFD